MKRIERNTRRLNVRQGGKWQSMYDSLVRRGKKDLYCHMVRERDGAGKDV